MVQPLMQRPPSRRIPVVRSPRRREKARLRSTHALRFLNAREARRKRGEVFERPRRKDEGGRFDFVRGCHESQSHPAEDRSEPGKTERGRMKTITLCSFHTVCGLRRGNS